MDSNKNESRRDFLKAAGKTIAFSFAAMNLFSSESAWADSYLEDINKYDLLLARVKFPCNVLARARWNILPGAEKNILETFSTLVRCKVKIPVGCQDRNPLHGTDFQFNAVVDLSDLEELRRYPFLLMTSDGSYALEDKQKKNLKAYIDGGGFILMDDCVEGVSGEHFFKCSFKMLEELYGSGSVKKIPVDHEVFHNIYDFGDKGMPHIVGRDDPAMGLFIGDRMAIFLSKTDLHCGCANLWDRQKYDNSIRMCINILMYAVSH